LNYYDVNQLGGQQVLPLAWTSMQDSLVFKTHFIGSTTEKNYLDVYEEQFLDLWQQISSIMKSCYDPKTSEHVREMLNSTGY
jgi:hypothetical protein